MQQSPPRFAARGIVVISVASVAVPFVASRRGVAGGLPVTPEFSTTSLSRIADEIGGNSHCARTRPRPVLTRERARPGGVRDQ
ncbi:hypothetical protein EEB14_50415 [Rhodococcus sp. WS4]|nr:hypothetical protein EEB14_50415 [Rhodococcus sp. WS4]